MKISLQLLLVALAARPSHAIFDFLFGALDLPNLFNNFAQQACDAGTNALGLANVACTCTTNFDLLSFISTLNVGADVECSTTEGLCLLDGGLCGGVDLKVGVEAGGSGFGGNVTSCFNIDSGLPAELADSGLPQEFNLCFTGRATGLELMDCDLTIGGDACETCTICPNGFTFRGDCSNVDLAMGLLEPLGTTVAGPVLDTCLLTTGTPPEEE